LKERVRINKQIRASELRVVDSEGENLGAMSTADALAKAEAEGLDLIEISPNANPPVAKIIDYGKYQYEQKKKLKTTKTHTTEVKNVQVKVGTGEHDLALKARKASEFLKEGNRVKVELFLSGRSKYMDRNFLSERLDRILNLITEEYKVAEPAKKGPKGLYMIIERAK